METIHNGYRIAEHIASWREVATERHVLRRIAHQEGVVPEIAKTIPKIEIPVPATRAQNRPPESNPRDEESPWMSGG
jgi:hypothetical protein